MAQLNTAKLNSVSYMWTDGTPFNGFLLFALVPPYIGDYATPRFALGDVVPEYQIPQFAIWPIKNGTPNAELALLQNSSISPPGTQYVVFLYDVSKRLIYGPSAPFEILGSTFTPPPLLALSPEVYGDIPTPDQIQDPNSEVIMIPIFGGYYTIVVSNNEAAINLANGFNQKLVLTSATPVTVKNPTRSAGLVEGMSFNLFIYQDATGSRPTPTFDSAFDTSISSFVMPSAANSFVVLQFTYHPDGKWRANSIGPIFT